MPFSIFKSFTIGALFFALPALSAAFSPSSSMQVQATQRVKSVLMYHQDSQIDVENVASTLLSNTSPQFEIAAPKKTKHLVKIDFNDHLSKYLDVTRPYYALHNEHAIVDDTTGECHGIICTVKRDAPIARETGGISFFEFLRASGCAASAALALGNPEKKRHHYPASYYNVDTNPDHDEKLQKELSSIANIEVFLEEASDPVFLMMSTGMSKRSGKIFGLLKTNDTVWLINGGVSIISAALFRRRFPPSLLSPPTNSIYASGNPYENLSSKLQNIKTYSSCDQDWVAVEGTLSEVTPDDCSGHFHDNPCLPHSSMIFHSCDLLGIAIEKLTGVQIPFKRSDFGQENGLKLLSFQCTPEHLHFPNTYDLNLQSKVYCSSGEMGKPESTYVVELKAVQDVTGIVCFKATGRFAISPVLFTKVAFRSALAAGDVATIWKKVDVNGDGVVSREELDQFINSTGHFNLDKKGIDMSFQHIDTDQSGDISFNEFENFFATLQEDYYGTSLLHDSADTLKSQLNIRDWLSITSTDGAALINSHNATVAFV